MREGRVAGKVASVSGGAQGMGEAHVRMLSQHGAQVVIADLNDQRGRPLAQELGDSVLYAPVDVTDPHSGTARWRWPTPASVR